MSIHFGTDGIRGKFGEDLTIDIAYKCGNSLNGNLIIGRDTRQSGIEIVKAFTKGALDAGCNVTEIGVCTTPCVAYLTLNKNFDYGIMITASHNPAEYNGIKIFSGKGLKLSQDIEKSIENHINNAQVNLYNTGIYNKAPTLLDEYVNFIKSTAKTNFNNIKVVLDCANGASYDIAPKVFKSLGAEVVAISCTPDGTNINLNCGSLHPDNLVDAVLKNKANFGFAFDGDADRILAVDEEGNILDGDKLMYFFAKYYLAEGKLTNKQVVGTVMSNLGVEKALNNMGISLVRTNVGDKYVSEALINNNLLIGAEQSGHIILYDIFPTGDGVLNAIQVVNACVQSNKKLSQFIDYKPYKQTTINVFVKDKDAIMQKTELTKQVSTQNNKIAGQGRILVRKSGTEPCIRVMVESASQDICNKYSQELVEFIKDLDC